MNYEFSFRNLAPSIRVCTVNAPGFKTACISISLATQLSSTNSEKSLLAGLLSNSSAQYPDVTRLSRRLAELYGADVSVSVSKIGEQQALKLTVGFISDRFALDGESIAASCFELLRELVFNPLLGEDGLFTEDDIQREKRLLAEKIDNELNDKALFAKRRLEQLMFSGELYALNQLGTADDARALTARSVYNTYRELLKTATIQINLVGDMDFEAVTESLSDCFSGIDRAPVKLETRFIPTAEEPSYVSESEQVKQGKLVLGFRAGTESVEDNYCAVRVMADMFGGGAHSKLFMNVREKMSLCYYCSARFISTKGVIIVQSGIETENEEKAKAAILAQLEDMKNGNFTDDELKASLDYLVDRFNSISDTPEELDEWFAQQITSPTLKSAKEYSEEFPSVTREQVIEAARRVSLDTVYMLKGEAQD